MNQRPRLVTSRTVAADVSSGALVSSYRLLLPDGGALHVDHPTALGDVGLVVEHLRDLADALAAEADLGSGEPSMREQLLRTSEHLRYASERIKPRDLGALRDLLGYYGDFRDRVVRYLHCLAPGGGAHRE